jgi:NosR/NirI family nitrous oxide reductase transcriptional regulator
VLIILAATASFLPRRRYLRTVVLVLSVPMVGLWLNTPITIGDLVDLRNLGLPGLARLPLIILLIFALAASLFRGNLYCTYLCPFGALQMGAAALRLPKCSPDRRVERSASWLRWIITPMVVYAIAALGSEAFRTIEPFALCFSPAAGVYVWVQTGVVLVAALFVRRIWCRFFCPTGLFLDVLALVGGKLKHGIVSLIRRRRAAS